MKLPSFKTTIYGTAALLILTTHEVLASGFTNPLKGGSGSIDSLLNTVIDVVIFMLVPVIILMLVYSGFLFVQAQGNPAKISEAKKVFVWTLIGAFVILAARELKEVVVATVNSL